MRLSKEEIQDIFTKEEWRLKGSTLKVFGEYLAKTVRTFARVADGS